jgi:hypothetical protein
MDVTFPELETTVKQETCACPEIRRSATKRLQLFACDLNHWGHLTMQFEHVSFGITLVQLNERARGQSARS